MTDRRWLFPRDLMAEGPATQRRDPSWHWKLAKAAYRRSIPSHEFADEALPLSRSSEQPHQAVVDGRPLEKAINAARSVTLVCHFSYGAGSGCGRATAYLRKRASAPHAARRMSCGISGIRYRQS